jgi:hypothetical protein
VFVGLAGAAHFAPYVSNCATAIVAGEGISLSTTSAVRRQMVGSALLHKRADQPQQCNVLRTINAADQELRDLEVDRLPTRSGIGLMPDDHLIRCGTTNEVPALAVLTAVEQPCMSHGPSLLPLHARP